MKRVSLDEAQAELPELITAAEQGGEIEISTDAGPVARIVPVAPPRRPFKFGSLAGKVEHIPDFLEPLPEDELRLWEGR